ncbi:hypothetical protein HanRHA438_Chr15g0708751 [Helianthus annuus]|uniref:Uncharacterized protein n=1 Tax=Helianthus annuus TaxID=4232 RepID=A0A251S9Q0_HELAN|nr:hypothetical protein HanXRQr2_Chr15g0696331 [Helianthus annuus]KAJ0451445.1 hypothetical protein HanHA300_Chr15g0567611 [Helianthus annuus]KAJ0455959.1 hypothetical protein HanIR_Chr15g0756981 [Helianthus annuus]KAJ0473322.1 hypothetical protein HanHA89_Chr15g0616991 [Helianthus annuus]KAJ0648904.1 hypothetical protein HanLR1_Chr15g0578121 [Helianthus annuus]
MFLDAILLFSLFSFNSLIRLILLFLNSPSFVKMCSSYGNPQSIINQLKIFYKIMNTFPLLSLINYLFIIEEFKR